MLSKSDVDRMVNEASATPKRIASARRGRDSQSGRRPGLPGRSDAARSRRQGRARGPGRDRASCRGRQDGSQGQRSGCVESSRRRPRRAAAEGQHGGLSGHPADRFPRPEAPQATTAISPSRPVDPQTRVTRRSSKRVQGGLIQVSVNRPAERRTARSGEARSRAPCAGLPEARAPEARAALADINPNGCPPRAGLPGCRPWAGPPNPGPPNPGPGNPGPGPGNPAAGSPYDGTRSTIRSSSSFSRSAKRDPAIPGRSRPRPDGPPRTSTGRPEPASCAFAGAV